MVANCHLENQKIISQNHLHRFQQNFSVLIHNGLPSLTATKCTVGDNITASISELQFIH